ncbi:DUF2977 domain-containing protein [Listeria monocytogenes]|nr:DUF2977 domain-containing protein [Listeria monocytogenes]EAE6367144.1 DUF2977 domain-containing protein [Listeria monocytogenes]EAF8229092.1 DUF2977 domain-containing protein [Listeria monocytogenes]EAG1865906.1 DUF2977 domain-containing protein [Listeria monocytogenes]
MGDNDMFLKLNERNEIIAYAVDGSIEGAFETNKVEVESLENFRPKKYKLESGHVQFNERYTETELDIEEDHTIEKLKKENAELTMYIAEVEVKAEMANQNGADLMMLLAEKGAI